MYGATSQLIRYLIFPCLFYNGHKLLLRRARLKSIFFPPRDGSDDLRPHNRPKLDYREWEHKELKPIELQSSSQVLIATGETSFENETYGFMKKEKKGNK